jgi:hypothetical protein
MAGGRSSTLPGGSKPLEADVADSRHTGIFAHCMRQPLSHSMVKLALTLATENVNVAGIGNSLLLRADGGE